MTKDNRPNPELWTCYLQYLAADGVTPVTEVVLYEGEVELDRHQYFGLKPVDGLLMARTHVVSVLARLMAPQEPELQDTSESNGEVQLYLPFGPAE